MIFYDYNSGGYLGGSLRYTTALPGMYSLNDSASAVPRNNLALWLDAANLNSYPGSGTTWTDMSGNGKNATLTSATLNSVFGGLINMSAPGYATLGDNFKYVSQSFSVMFHFFWNNNPTPSTTSDADHLFSKGAGYTNGYILRLTAQGQLIFTTGQSGGSQSASTYGSVLRPQENHIITVVYTYGASNTSTCKIYVNGVDVTASSVTHTNPTDNTSNFRIGANATPSAYTRGQCGFFMIYEKVLSIDEIWTIFNLYKPRYGI